MSSGRLWDVAIGLATTTAALAGLALGILFFVPTLEICDNSNRPIDLVRDADEAWHVPIFLGPHLLGLAVLLLSVWVLRHRDLRRTPAPRFWSLALLALLATQVCGWLWVWQDNNWDLEALPFVAVPSLMLIAAVAAFAWARRAAAPWAIAAATGVASGTLFGVVLYEEDLLPGGVAAAASCVAIAVAGALLFIQAETTPPGGDAPGSG